MKYGKTRQGTYYLQLGFPWIVSWRNEKTGHEEGYYGAPRFDLQFRFWEYFRLHIYYGQ